LPADDGTFSVSPRAGETHWFSAGDLVAIPAGACVKRLVRRPARGLTLKVPSSAGKVHCGECPRECTWRVEPFAGPR